MRTWVGAAVVLVVLACCGPAQAQIPSSVWDAGMTDDGRPSLGVSANLGDGVVFVAALRCPGDAACEQPVSVTPIANGTWLSVDVSGAGPGDAFAIRYSDGQTWRTPAWRGSPRVTGPPSLSGTPVVGEKIRTSLATWDGGWAGGWPGGWKNDAATAIAACRTADANDCVVLSSSSSRSVTLDPAWAGRYLFATSSVWFWNGWVSVEAAPPYAIGDLRSGPRVTLSRPLGPVAMTAAWIRPRAFSVKGGLSVARVTCATGCAVRLTVSGSGETVRRALTVKGKKGLTIPRRHGRLKVTIVVDGKTLARGSTFAR